ALAATRVGIDFVPSVDQGEVRVVLEMKPGTPIRETERTVQRIEELTKDPQVLPYLERDRMWASGGEVSGGTDRLPERGANFAELRLKLVDKEGVLNWLLRPFTGRRLREESDQEVAERLREILSREALPVDRVAVSAARSATSRGHSAVVLTLWG